MPPRRFAWKPVAAAVLVLAASSTMIGLGVWQLTRLQERRARNVLIEERLAAPPVDLHAASIDSGAELEYRRAVVRGTFDSVHEIVLRNRSWKGSAGVHVITPLLIAGSDAAVLVDRGWLPLDQASPEARVAFVEQGEVEVRGILFLSSPRSASFLPADSTPAPGSRLDAWFWLDIPGIQRQIPYPLLPIYLERDPESHDRSLPISSHSLDLNDGPHLGYAIQWFSFAFITLAGSAALARRSNALGSLG